MCYTISLMKRTPPIVLIACAIYILVCPPGDAQNEGPERVKKKAQKKQQRPPESVTPHTVPAPVPDKSARDLRESPSDQSHGANVEKRNDEQPVSITSISEAPVQPSQDAYDKVLVFATA